MKAWQQRGSVSSMRISRTVLAALAVLTIAASALLLSPLVGSFQPGFREGHFVCGLQFHARRLAWNK